MATVENTNLSQVELAESGAEARCLCWDDALGPTVAALQEARPGVVFNLTECPRQNCLKAPHAAAVLELLGVPDTHVVAGVLALGHPVHQPTRLRRGPVDGFTTVDRFDGPLLGSG